MAPTPRPNVVVRWCADRAAGLTVANVVGQVFIVLTGGLVRLTNSGLGCSSWPNCEPGEFVPVPWDAASYHPLVEYGNRTVAVGLAALGVAMAVGVWRTRPELRWWGLVPLVGVIAQAVLGGITVNVELNPWFVGPHMLLSVGLIWASTWIALRYRNAPGRPSGPSLAVLRWASLALFVAVVFLGVLTTGAGPHSGDSDATERLALDPEHLAKVHAGVVWAFVAVVAALGLALWKRRAEGSEGAARSAVEWLALATLAQGAIGYVQYLTGLPVAVVALHMLGVGALTVAHAAAFHLTRRS